MEENSIAKDTCTVLRLGKQIDDILNKTLSLTEEQLEEIRNKQKIIDEIKSKYIEK